jgi:prephenate dehydratase
MQKKIAYQGTKASFSEMAILRYFGQCVEPIGKVTFEEVFDSLAKAEVDFAVLPVENSLIGPIFENFDLIAGQDVSVVAEVCLQIEHCLVGKKGQQIEQIRKVYSHPKALAQCTGFFQTHPWLEPVVHFDTAGAVRDMGLSGDLGLAAIGSKKTAEVYNLEILRSNLEDDASNTTRFWVLKKGSEAEGRGGKCSLLFTLKHVPGALAEVLSVLANCGVNLTQIVSRPIREKPFEYLFFVDIVFSEGIEETMEALRSKTQTLKLLGHYEPAT